MEKKCEIKNIVFLNGEEVSKHACLTQSDYFSNMNTTNRTIRGYDVSCSDLATYCLPQWTQSQKQKIVQNLQTIYRNIQSLFFFFSDSWYFAVVQNKYEGGLPHTLGQIILLPENSFSYSDIHFIKLLLHERIHTLQKKYYQTFSQLYISYWGCTPIHENNINSIYLQEHRCNPDTPRWWSINGWIPIVLFKIDARTLTDVDYKFLKYQENGMSPLLIEQSECEWYKQLIGSHRHCYHPDETSAVMLTEYLYTTIVSNQTYIPSGQFDKKIMEWVKTI